MNLSPYLTNGRFDCDPKYWENDMDEELTHEDIIALAEDGDVNAINELVADSKAFRALVEHGFIVQYNHMSVFLSDSDGNQINMRGIKGDKVGATRTSIEKALSR